MKIRRFIGRSVNGYLHFNIRFFDHLTLVTGINGSGKTSALNSIAALLLPRLDYLATQQFDELSIDIRDDNGKVKLTAQKTPDATAITCSRFPKDQLTFAEFDNPESVPAHRYREYEEDYYNNILSRNATNPILSFIKSLPTPMYLGLDRRSLSIESDRLRHRPISRARHRARRNVFGGSLEAGLTEALYFAREWFQENRRRELELDEKFRQSLVLALIDFPLFSLYRNLESPSKNELKTIERARAHLERLPDLLNVDKEMISERLNPVFQFLQEKLKTIEGRPDESEDRNIALFEWSYNKANLDKIIRLSDIMSEYTSDIASIRHRTNDYLQLVNNFIQDSGKTILFNDFGELRFRIEEEVSNREMHTFSSGEVQLVVILTHLYFNPEVEKANIFILDEPELSLHVQWQEKFVDAIMKASEETQFILATHSPSIILDKINRCVDLSRR